MPYRDKKDKDEHNSKYYWNNVETLKRKRRERYRCLIKTQLKQKKTQEKII
jgi:hypothetical protein